MLLLRAHTLNFYFNCSKIHYSFIHHSYFLNIFPRKSKEILSVIYNIQ